MYKTQGGSRDYCTHTHTFYLVLDVLGVAALVPPADGTPGDHTCSLCPLVETVRKQCFHQSPVNLVETLWNNFSFLQKTSHVSVYDILKTQLATAVKVSQSKARQQQQRSVYSLLSGPCSQNGKTM